MKKCCKVRMLSDGEASDWLRNSFCSRTATPKTRSQPVIKNCVCSVKKNVLEVQEVMVWPPHRGLISTKRQEDVSQPGWFSNLPAEFLQTLRASLKNQCCIEGDTKYRLDLLTDKKKKRQKTIGTSILKASLLNSTFFPTPA